MNGMYEELLEKLRKNNRMSGWTHIDRLIDEAAEAIEALQQENEQLKEQINTAKIGWDTYKTYSEQLEQQTAESNKIIETQRQEIKKLKATLADWKYNAKCDADHIAALTTDKDELVKVLKQARAALEEIEKCCEINVDDGYHTCQRKCREAAARVRFVREVIDELEGSEWER